MPNGHNWQAAALESVQSKLVQLHQSLSQEERPVLDALLAQAAASATARPAEQKESIIFVGGHTVLVWVNPATWISLNPQPIPPGRPVIR